MALDKIITDYVLNLKTFKKQTKEIEKDLEGVEDSVKDSTKNVSKEMDNFGKVTKKIGGFIAAAFAAEKIISFGKELVDIQRKAEGIQTAFDRLNSPLLLNKLRKATKGTVNDLELMQRAVQAKNYNIPLNQLATLFEFARRRAKQTGEEVDTLVDKIVLGLGRKSPLILDDLGVSSHRLRKALNGVSVEASSVGQFVKAFGDIAEEELSNMGEDILTLNERILENQTRWENLKLELSEKFLPVMIGASEAIADFTEVAITDKLSIWEKALGFFVGGALPVMTGKVKELTESEELLNEVQSMVNTLIEHQIKLSPILVRSAEKQAEANNEDAHSIAFIREQYEKLQASLAKSADEGASFSIKILREEISNLKKEIDDTDGSGKRFQTLVDRLSVKQKKLNDIMFRYNALLKARQNIEEDLADDSPIEAEIDSIIARDQAALDSADNRANAESDLQAEVDRLREAQKEKDKEFDKEQEEKNTQFLENASGRYAEVSEAALSSFSEIANNITQIQMQNLERQLQSGQITQEQFERRRIELLREQALRDKAFKLFEAITNTAVAVTAELKKGPAAAALAGVLGAAQIAAIISQPLPQFAEGVIGLQGPGTGTSDSIPAMLSAGESVMTAQETADHYDALMAMRKNSFDEYINKNHVLPILAKSAELDAQQAAQLMAVGNALSGDNIPLIHAIQSNGNKRNRNSDKNAEYIAKEVGRTIVREGYFRNRYS